MKKLFVLLLTLVLLLGMAALAEAPAADAAAEVVETVETAAEETAETVEMAEGAAEEAAEEAAGGFLDGVATANNAVNGVVWGVPALILLAFVGILMTCLTGVFQVSHIGHWFQKTIGAVFRDKHITGHTADKSISQFQSLCTALAATVGTGNIVGVAGADPAGLCGRVDDGPDQGVPADPHQALDEQDHRRGVPRQARHRPHRRQEDRKSTRLNSSHAT